MQRIQIRFNTKFAESPGSRLKWRVLVNGAEHLASHVKVCVPCETTEDVIEEGVVKWHLTCQGSAVWSGDAITIR